MFIDLSDRHINLLNVSNINLLNDKMRIVFNMNYSINIEINHYDKKISDYVYWDAFNVNEFEDNLRCLLQSEYFKSNFIEHTNGYINLNEISSIKYLARKNRVIFNLSHPVTFKDFDGKNKITSEFVYVNFNKDEDYDNYVKYVRKTLGEK